MWVLILFLGGVLSDEHHRGVPIYAGESPDLTPLISNYELRQPRPPLPDKIEDDLDRYGQSSHHQYPHYVPEGNSVSYQSPSRGVPQHNGLYVPTHQNSIKPNNGYDQVNQKLRHLFDNVTDVFEYGKDDGNLIVISDVQGVIGEQEKVHVVPLTIPECHAPAHVTVKVTNYIAPPAVNLDQSELAVTFRYRIHQYSVSKYRITIRGIMIENCRPQSARHQLN